MKLTDKEKQLAEFCIKVALEQGAEAARASLSKAVTDTYSTLNGTLDKVSHCADRSIFFHLFVDGRYGTYSTNMLDEEQLRLFVSQAVDSTRILAADSCRRLPDFDRCTTEAVNGDEMELYDPEYEKQTAEDRLAIVTSAQVPSDTDKYKVISVECEYSENIDDNFIIDSNGFKASHLETSFTVCTEMTIADRKGNRYSSFWWEGSPIKANLFKDCNPVEKCYATALEKAIAQINPGRTRGGSRTMVVDRNVASRLVSPILSAINGYAIQQRNSFLLDKLGEKVFPESLSIYDYPHKKGQSGARLFDSEGVATKERAIIDKGVVKTYFIDTYMSGKLETEPTIEGPSVPTILPYSCKDLGNDLNLQAILKECRRGILVTGFNGGNCNSATGNFSYGVEGFVFRNGKIVKPVRELLITGNIVDLWNNLIIAGNDPRNCSRWQVPTLAFRDVNFSA